MGNMTDKERALRDEICGKLKRHYGRTVEEATKVQLYKAIGLTLRDKMMEKWTAYKQRQHKELNKELYYLSFEFLMGRSLANNLLNTGMTEEFESTLGKMGIDLNDVIGMEPDAGLGNGGLGRLAACFMDSLATLDMSAYGASIRYEYGLFKQAIVDGYQVEMPDDWLDEGTIWEVARPEEQVDVRFGGKVNLSFADGSTHVSYEGCTVVVGIPFDVPVCGYNSDVVNTLRLWSAHSKKEFDMRLFSGGDYLKATEEKASAEMISKVLYPEDNHTEGKALRLRQQYFFVSTTIQWIVARYKKYHGADLSRLPEKVVIHINDTHPALAIPELMRVLMDDEGLGWDDAWTVVTKVFAYTNHTVLSEALEKWPMTLVQEILPRVWMIIDEINNRLIAQLRVRYGDDWGKINYMSVVAHEYISMANLCLSTCFAVNGVSKLHTEILQQRVFNDYYNMAPYKFYAITNGITFRRWIKLANRDLANLITDKIGKDWLKNSAELKNLEAFADDLEFQREFSDIKQKNKALMAKYFKQHNNINVDVNSMFDVHVKRLHEYKRQLLNALHILYLYRKILDNPSVQMLPRTFIFGAKASPGYARAKLIIKLINSIADKVNNDPLVDGRIKVVFIENYGVSIAQNVVAAAELSKQISTAGKEASGTGNMKFMLNGALTLGTLDGANVEISEQVGLDNIYLFGMTADEVEEEFKFNKNPASHIYNSHDHVKRTLDMLTDGSLTNNHNLFNEITQSLLLGDYIMSDPYMVVRDFTSYIEANERVDDEYNKQIWWRKAIINTANAGMFSSDRTIGEYNKKIWHLK